MTRAIAVALLGSVMGLSSLLSHAEAAVRRCDACTSDYDFRLIAQEIGPGDHLIYNLQDNILQRWRIPYDSPPIDPFGQQGSRALPSSSHPTELTPQAGAVKELDKAHRVYNIGGSVRPMINVPVSVLDLMPQVQNKTAYNVINDFNLRGMIESAAAHPDVVSTVTGANLQTAIADLMVLVQSYLGLRDQTGLMFRIVMSDGSSVYVFVKLDHPIGEFVEGTARTDGGQIIPETRNAVQGEWHGGPGVDNLAPMVSHIRGLGGAITYSGGSSGTVTGISCTPEICVVTTVPN
ncbi:hypothetical protein [Luteimonas salinilitoris]|uniref:Uncharacterized protein n=1 Tax=Luteimonas salinilitoris TaxID=3237697 RepID=A0ABV4HNH5_9GAMM